MPTKPDKRYGERDSPFFRMRSRAKLAQLLFISRTKLETLAGEQDFYFQFTKRKSSGGIREINAPRKDLKKVQARIAELLRRIAPPDYLFAPVSGRSYVDNAAAHLGARSIRLLDIEDFFPSCTANRAFWFFHKRMECSPDVAAVLRGIVTHRGSLPQGSPCSPILAFLCYVDMWEKIASIAENAGCTLTVYADDVTLSAETIREQAVWEIKQALWKHGHRYNIDKERSIRDRPTEITGVILKQSRIHAPNRQHKKLHDISQKARRMIHAGGQRAALMAQIRGREAQMNQIESGNRL